MNAKHYVSLEVAQMLRKKGYNEERDFLAPVYTKDGVLYWSNHEDLSQMTPAPTLLEAMDWLEERGIRISIKYDWIKCRWYYIVIDGTPTIKNITEVEKSDGIFYTDRNECMNAAVKKGMELL